MHLTLSPIQPMTRLGVRVRRDRARCRGAALVIVLAFVVLLTGLVVAFFSRSITARQVSNGSINQMKAGLFAQGAAATIVGDLRQEILAGSDLAPLPSPPPSPTPPPIYLPKAGDGSTYANTVLPTQVGVPATGSSLDYPNLLKRSVYNKPFYPAFKGANGAGPSRASNISTLAVSQNFRSVTPPRWNAPLLLPKPASPAPGSAVDDPSPDGASKSTGSGGGTTWDWKDNKGVVYAPDWILVARDGSNPVIANSNTAPSAAQKWSNTNPNAIVGRYAYTIYHEGGLLDINAAGRPSLGGSAPPPANYLSAPAYKSGLPFADLQQIPVPDPDAATRNFLNYEAGTTVPGRIDQLVAWRNLASASGIGGPNPSPITGVFPNLAWNSNAKQNYFDFAKFGNTTGFITVDNALGLVDGIKSDRQIVSRQNLIQFMRTMANMKGTIGSSASAASPEQRAAAQNVLQYLTTFSRDINQPSYIPDVNRPRVTDSANGGNNAGPPPGQQTGGGDDLINPSFLSMRVATIFNRYDGSNAAVGDPLVKTRFALSRLAWLTFKGPIATGTGTTGTLSTDPDIKNVIADLKSRGFTDDFLKRGTSTTIGNYFGLSWSNGVWTYNQLNTSKAIMKLSEVATAKREANFVELVKASVDVGSIAKPSVKDPAKDPNPNRDKSVLEPSNWQFSRDYSVDRAVMQIVANIIDQFDVDGYPTRMLLAGDAPTKEVEGVENLPYIYKIRDGVLKLREANPAPQQPDSTNDNNVNEKHPNSPPNGPLKDSGVAALMLMPEIWNPHSETSSLGNPRPTNFRVVVDSADPDSITGNTNTYNQIKVVGWKNSDQYWTDLDAKLPPAGINWTRGPDGSGAPFTGNYKSVARKLSQANSALTFTVPDAKAFREPTLLFKPGQPAKTNLAMDMASIQKNDPTFAADLAPFFSGNGLKAVGDPNPAREPVAPAAGQEYAGICVGLFPLRFIGASNLVYTVKWGSTDVGGARAQKVPAQPVSTPHAYFTYRLQYQDQNQNWLDYDKKYSGLYADQVKIPYLAGINGQPSSGGLLNEFAEISAFVDPRTARFGAVIGSWTGVKGFEASGYNGSDWIDSKQGYLVSDRPDTSAGFSPNWGGGNNLPGWENEKAGGWMNLNSFRRGMFSQNLVTLDSKPVNDDGRKFSGDAVTAAGGGEYYADADMVVRRAMGGYVLPSANAPATTTVGLPLAKLSLSTGAQKQQDSRPIVLNRPFQSVAELGYVFSGTPWKNLDFFAPESGFAPMLDVFCLTEAGDSRGLVAGKVNLNTRQAPVLQAVLAGAYKDEFNAASSTLNDADTLKLVQALITRTKDMSAAKGPLVNISELVGKYTSTTASGITDGDQKYDGFSKDLTTIFGDSGSSPDPATNNIQRFRESVVRPLAAMGQTRVWNLMIDVIAQTGRYPANAANSRAFAVEGERRLWVHVAIDRLTGDVIDQQVEVVNE